MTETLPGTSSHHRLEVTAWCAVPGPHLTRGALSTRGAGTTARWGVIESYFNGCPDTLQFLLSVIVLYPVFSSDVSVSAVLRKSLVRAAK